MKQVSFSQRPLRLAKHFLWLFLFVGCQEKELVVGLSARERVSAISVLNSAGILTDEERQSSGSGKESYTLKVSDSDYPTAIKIIEQLGFPRDQTSSSSELLGKDSLIPPTPELIALRLDFALSQKIRELIEQLPGVVSANVLYRKENLAQRASVVVQYQSSIESPEEAIKNIVKQALPSEFPLNLEVHSVPLTLGSAQGALVAFAKPFSFKISSQEKDRATSQVFFVLVLSSLAAAVVGFFAGLTYSAFMWRRMEKAKAARRRTGEFPLMQMKTAHSLASFKADDSSKEKS
jgi:type III secretory pathway lipoprotein EscJ